jgi:hypothetical protein
MTVQRERQLVALEEECCGHSRIGISVANQVNQMAVKERVGLKKG